jgi:signal transduction histidine kinase
VTGVTGGSGTLATRVARTPTTLRESLRRALSVAGVALGVLVLFALVSVVQVVRAQQDVTDLYYRAVAEANRGYRSLLDAETGVRGYALTADPAALQPFTDVVEADDGGTTADLEDDLARDVELIEARERAVEVARTWFVDFALPTVAAVEDGGTAAVSPEDVERGRVLFDAVRDAVDDYLAEIQAHRAAALDRLETWTRLLVASTAALVLGALAVGFGLWVVLGRSITEPLAALAADAREVGSGVLGHPVRATGPGEIAALAADVETMRQVLVRQVDEAADAAARLTDAHRRLTEQAEVLQRSNRDLEQFAYVASHDLQEPLRKVASFTQLLQKRYGGQLDERADQYIDFAVDGAKRMQRLIQDLLGFSRVGRLSGEAVDVDLAGALADATANLDQAIAEAGATVTHDRLPVVRAERALVVQLLQNLVGNAVKFRDPARPPHVHLTARRSGDRWELECRDNGIGIDEQYADRVFVIFQRLHPKDSYEGTGIGLSLCKRIVEHHGGEIWIAPVTDGAGTSIRFTLPAVPAVPSVPAVPDGVPAYPPDDVPDGVVDHVLAPVPDRGPDDPGARSLPNPLTPTTSAPGREEDRRP